MDNAYAHPRPSLAGRMLERLCNARRLAAVRRALAARLPFPVLESDVRDVVYVTWLVDRGRAARLVPPWLDLLDFEGLTPFTVLSYRHGHFGPRLLGPLRRLLPSPLQSNWRVYLRSPPPGAPDIPTVVFLKKVFDSLLYTLGSRVASDALPSHLAAGFALDTRGATVRVRLAPGTGSAPRLDLRAARAREAQLPGAFARHYTDWRDAVARLATQEAAVAAIAGTRAVGYAAISLPVAVGTVVALETDAGSTVCPFVQALGPQPESLSFLLPRVRFRVLSERVLPLP